MGWKGNKMEREAYFQGGNTTHREFHATKEKWLLLRAKRSWIAFHMSEYVSQLNNEIAGEVE